MVFLTWWKILQQSKLNFYIFYILIIKQYCDLKIFKKGVAKEIPSMIVKNKFSAETSKSCFVETKTWRTFLQIDINIHTDTQVRRKP